MKHRFVRLIGAICGGAVSGAFASAAAGQPAQLQPPFEPLAQLAGDWELSGGALPTPEVLRLRLDARGALTGAIDVPEPMSARAALKNVEVSGRTLRYTTDDGHVYEGTFSADGRTVAATGTSTVDGTWRHVRTGAQAAARDAAADSSPTNGVWSGTGNYTASFPGMPVTRSTAKLEFHFRSNPASCSVQWVGDGTDVPCQMIWSGDGIRLYVIGYRATFTGVLGADKKHLRGTWIMGSAWHWKGPMQIELVREPRAGRPGSPANHVG